MNATAPVPAVASGLESLPQDELGHSRLFKGITHSVKIYNIHFPGNDALLRLIQNGIFQITEVLFFQTGNANIKIGGIMVRSFRPGAKQEYPAFQISRRRRMATK